MIKCQRCRKETITVIMSIFNTELICLKCKEEETKYSDYKLAMKVESDEVNKGNNNFKGIEKNF